MNPLPTPTSRFQVPLYFSPSRWHDIQSCPVRAFALPSGSLPISLPALTGIFLHQVRYEILAAGEVGPDRQDAARARINAMTQAREQELLSDPDYQGLAPFAASLGRLTWAGKVDQVLAWAMDAKPFPAGAATGSGVARNVSGRGIGHHLANTFKLGAEVQWICNEWRLNGRVDRARMLPDGSIEICDYKTGTSLFRDGNLPPHILWQMRLYLLMAETLTGKSASAYVEGAVRIRVPWGKDEKEETRASLEEAASKFPGLQDVDAVSNSRPGRICIGCPHRPSCSPYLDAAPRWWPNNGNNPRPLPFDTWGTLATQFGAMSQGTVELQTPEGHRTILRGIPQSLDFALMTSGDVLYCFDLQPSSDTEMHGRSLHPQAFHIQWPNKERPQALQARFFIQKL